MKIEFNFGKRVTVIPSAAWDKLERATKLDIKVLFALSGACDGVDLSNITSDSLAELIGVKPSQIEDSIGFWVNAGVISAENVEPQEKVEAPKEKQSKGADAKKVMVRRSDEIPNYTTEELSVILEKRKETSYFLDECQQELGKMFNTHEINVVLGMTDYLGLSFAYILSLLAYCRSIGKRSVNYAEKLAFSFVEEGIETEEALKLKVAELGTVAANESSVRKLFGMKARALTAKEKKCIALWFGKFGYNIDIVSLAYEITVSNTNEASVPYAHAILERWNTEGLTTLEDIQRSIDEHSAQKVQKAQDSGSFDTDDFFAAALERSYKDNKK